MPLSLLARKVKGGSNRLGRVRVELLLFTRDDDTINLRAVDFHKYLYECELLVAVQAE